MYPQTFYNLARAYAHLGQFSLAEKYYLDGVKHDESFFPFYRGLARLYWRMGDKAKAQEAQQRYERLRPEDGPLDLNTAE
jgi:tetratricopeptide (TPR) repeat protein